MTRPIRVPNRFFDSPARSDGSQKWVDSVHTYWQVDCVRGNSLQAFTEHHQNWCRRKGHHFSVGKAETIYEASSDLIAVFPKDGNTKEANPASGRLPMNLINAFMGKNVHKENLTTFT